MDVSKLLKYGLIYPTIGGIQADINVASKADGTQVHLCDHCCVETANGTPTGGGYTCPASFLLNKGARNNFADAELLLQGILRTAEGIKISWKYFTRVIFPDYCLHFGIPKSVADEMLRIWEVKQLEVNLFGGNPEMHKQVIWLLQRLKQLGFRVNFTTTGRKFLDPTFLAGLLDNLPDVIALSADDLEGADQIQQLVGLRAPELKTQLRLISPYAGQQQKALEAIGAANALKDRNVAIIFNMVIHKGNLYRILEIMAALWKAFPNVRLNPYPAQTAFLYQEGEFDADDLIELERLIDSFIQWHLEPPASGEIVQRLHYWLVMKAVFIKWRWDVRRISNMIAGQDIWRCYRQLGANRYVQFGVSKYNSADVQVPGGHLNCFWNSETVTLANDQVWSMPPQAIANHVLGGNMWQSSASSNPCPGCAMPRLWFDIVTTELGLDPEMLPVYEQLRRDILGY